ncbi:response regulator [Deinococcus taeanensis]|uniref:response regulator transcription factor n=1 Tax=Deinococcus taeanensis TaxID=2737050 RepID=UPI001CDD636E|nr:response regulator [Deinococcus taeanensis]UBV42081.1 response regulator [Deinococcus taeanensis]
MAQILIVDDSPADLKFMEAALKGTSHTVTSLTDPAQVEAVADQVRPDLLLVDVVMPGRNGYEVVRGLRRQPGMETLKVVFVSSKGNETDVKWGLRQGADDYIVKPYTPEQVLGVITRLLG